MESVATNNGVVGAAPGILARKEGATLAEDCEVNLVVKHGQTRTRLKEERSILDGTNEIWPNGARTSPKSRRHLVLCKLILLRI